MSLTAPIDVLLVLLRVQVGEGDVERDVRACGAGEGSLGAGDVVQVDVGAVEVRGDRARVGAGVREVQLPLTSA